MTGGLGARFDQIFACGVWLDLQGQRHADDDGNNGGEPGHLLLLYLVLFLLLKEGLR